MPSAAFWTRSVLALGGTLTAAQATGHTIVGNGVTYIGTRDTAGGIDRYLSIPFAQPPTGSLRFKPPVAWTATGSNTTVNTTAYGYSCPQANPDYYYASSASEDCLTLYLWKPTNITEKLPVMVWIYGGGFYFGSAQAYERSYMVKPSITVGKPIIYVAMNYRTGIFGFPPVTNLLRRDQRLALEWVQENIEYFGGDKTKVTLFGESAGAISTSYQSLYKGGDIGGVLRGMIQQSSSPSSVNVPTADDPVQEKAYQFVVNATGCTSSDDTFECLRSAPSDVLQKANQDVIQVSLEWKGADQGPVVLGPVLALGDDFLPELPSVSLHAGRYAKVPFINEDVKDEGTVFINQTTPQTDQNVTDWLLSQALGLYFGISNATAVAALLKFYPSDPAAGSPYGTGNETWGLAAQYKRLASLAGNLIFKAGRRDHVRTATKDGVNVWSYSFNATANSLNPAYDSWGVQHTAENAFVFYDIDEFADGATVPDAFYRLQNATFNYWVNFAYNLDPNEPASYPYWPKYGSNATLIELGSEIGPIWDTYRAEGIEYIINTPSLYNRGMS
ncbi:Alpha/Beta hydrolase protein [Rhizoctonia solani]|nr:Alpha/Beta hydrolase protein [Rhizoctonia solani]